MLASFCRTLAASSDVDYTPNADTNLKR